MLWQRVRFALLAGACMAGTAMAARADHHAAPCGAPCGSGAGAGAGAGGAMTRVLVNEWVPETYQTTRTSCRMEQRQETFTAYRTECTPETRTRTFTVNRMVPEVQTRVITVAHSVPVCEQRTIMQAHWTCKPVTHVVRKCVDMGHYECREVPCGPTLCERIKKLCSRNCCEDPCPKTKIEKVWCPNKVWVETPVTKMERVCEHRPVTVTVNTCRKELRQETIQVTVCKCVPETRTETFTVNVARQVPYQATRTVCVNVPHQEVVTATRLVCRTVEKLVPADGGAGGAGDCCGTPCCVSCCKSRRCCK